MTQADKTTSHRRRWAFWGLMGVIALALIISSAGSPPTEGVSQNRLFNIASQLKCVECVGESVASSSAPVAVQFRQEITEQMGKGQTNDEILNYFASRYDDILLTPPSSGVGSLVWILPVVALFAAVLLLAAAFKNWSLDRSERVASTEDEELVAAALDGEPTGDQKDSAGG
ncbi:MAG TPA: cytochrome c-type biogenesis protein CcmH [Microthrixaceae bacterium]|nr:cytochrome c-type biogenesis protein CcmH [Microthrixaceae bacterium]